MGDPPVIRLGLKTSHNASELLRCGRSATAPAQDETERSSRVRIHESDARDFASEPGRPFFPLASRLRKPARSSMIPRYTRADMAAIWSPQMRFRIWFEIEAHAADAMAELGLIPKRAAQKIWSK